MKSTRSGGMINDILKGYGRALKTGLLLAGTAAAIFGSGFVIVYPLWLFADTSKAGYACFTLALFLAVTCTLAVKRIRKGLELSGGFRGYFAQAVLPLGRRLFVFTFGLGGLYVVTFLFFQGSLAAAVPAGLIFVFLLGILLYSRHGSA